MITIKGLTLDSILAESQKELISQRQKIRFRLPLSPQQVQEELEIAYARCVAYRGGQYNKDESTKIKIGKAANWLTSSSMKPMLLLSGDIGTGKTEMARSISHLILSLGDGARQLEHKNGCWRTTGQEDQEKANIFNTFVKLPKPMMISALDVVSLVDRDDKDRYDKDRYEATKKAPFLILDDLGTEPSKVMVYGSIRLPIVDLLMARYDEMAPTVITTNLNLKGIADYYGPRISDRLKEVSEILIFRGESYRE